MIEKLSSSWTFFYKVMFPIIWITGFGIGTFLLWIGEFDHPQLPSAEIKWEFLVAWLIGSGFCLWFALRLKAVTLNGDSLFIQNYSQEIFIPLSSINGVRESKLMNPKTIKLTLYPACTFGENVVFIPKSKFSNPFHEHPIVKQLKELSNQQ